jgi:imidazolonepropionase-like amidohydrolase
MKRLFRIALIIFIVLLIMGFAGYFKWVYNPYQDKLQLDPQAVFGNKQDSNSLLIRNADLIDVMAGEVVQDVHILIRGDTIAEVFAGKEPVVPTDASVYDARGKFIMPGLTDVHVHLAMYWNLISGDFSARDSLVTRAALEQFVRYGVTTVLVLGGGGANDEQVVALKKLEQRNAIVAPSIFAVGDQITVPGSHPVTTIMRLPADASQKRLHQAGVAVLAEGEDPAPILVKKNKLGLDGVKIVIESGPPPFYPNPRMSVQTARDIIAEAKKNSLPVYAHTESYDEFVDAVNLNVHAIMHSVIDTTVADPHVPQRMKQKGIWYVPTLSVFYGFEYLEEPERLEDNFLRSGVSRRTLRSLQHPLLQFGFGSVISDYDVSAWLENGIRNLAHFHGEGVNVALGTDASTPFNFPGYNAHVEMALMSRAGLSNADILRIATINGARFLGIEKRAGTIRSGNIASLIVLHENPLLDIRHTRTIDHVILKGRLIDPHMGVGSAAQEH